MTEVRIVIERVEDGYLATAYDEVGPLGQRFSSMQMVAAAGARLIARDKIADIEEILFRVEEIDRAE